MIPRWLLCSPLLFLPLATHVLAASAERAPRSCAQELGQQQARRWPRPVGHSPPPPVHPAIQPIAAP